MYEQKNAIIKALPHILIPNLIPFIGVFYLGWNAYSVFGIYILETIILGLIHAIKMGVLGSMKVLKEVKTGNPVESNMGCMIPFFLFHFMFFVFVQTMLSLGAMNLRHTQMGPIEFFVSLTRGETGLALLTFLIFTLFAAANDIRNAKEKYSNITASTMMMEPYGRIIVQQFVVIIGSFVVMLSGRTQLLVIIFILAKTAIELLLTVRKDLFALKE